MSTTGRRGCSGGDSDPRRPPGQAGRAGELGAGEQSLADAVRHRLLRYRADGSRRRQARHRPLRLRGDAVQSAAVRSHDRRRPSRHEDAAGPAAHLAANAGAEVVHFDGGVRVVRWRVRHLCGGPGGGSLHAGGPVYPRLPAAARAAAAGGHRSAGEDQKDRHADGHGVREAHRAHGAAGHAGQRR